jgi:hypothetical protein
LTITLVRFAVGPPAAVNRKTLTSPAFVELISEGIGIFVSATPFFAHTLLSPRKASTFDSRLDVVL